MYDHVCIYSVLFEGAMLQGYGWGFYEGYSVWYNGDVIQDVMTLGDINGNILSGYLTYPLVI